MQNNPENFIHYSGGARGADSEFDSITREYGINNHIHYWYKKPNPLSLPEHEITYEQYFEGVKHVMIANETLKRKGIEKYLHLLARNWFQVKNSENIYAIGNLKNKNQVDGGTGWATMMAINNSKPIYVFNQNENKWYFYNYTIGKFDFCVTPILCEKFAGIGTRDINENGINAIRNVCEKTFKNL